MCSPASVKFVNRHRRIFYGVQFIALNVQVVDSAFTLYSLVFVSEVRHKSLQWAPYASLSKITKNNYSEICGWMTWIGYRKSECQATEQLVDTFKGNQLRYPLDRDLSCRWLYTPLEREDTMPSETTILHFHVAHNTPCLNPKYAQELFLTSVIRWKRKRCLCKSLRVNKVLFLVMWKHPCWCF